MMSNLMRRALRPIQNATSESALFWPAGVTIWAGGLELYRALRPAGFPLTTAFFHCSNGGKTGLDSPAGLALWQKQPGTDVVSASKRQVRSAIRDNDLMYSPTGLIASIAEPCDPNVRRDRDGLSGW